MRRQATKTQQLHHAIIQLHDTPPMQRVRISTLSLQLFILIQIVSSTFDVPPAFFHRRGEPFNAHDFEEHPLYYEGCYEFSVSALAGPSTEDLKWCFTRHRPATTRLKDNIFDFLSSRRSLESRILQNVDDAFYRYSRNIILEYDYITIDGSSTHIGSSDNPNSRGSAYLQTTAGLLHSAEQLEYLVEQRKLPAAFLAIAQRYRDTLTYYGNTLRTPPSFHFRGTTFFPATLVDLQQQHFLFNTLLYYPPSPSFSPRSALNPNVNWVKVEQRYLKGEVVVIDHVLADWALEAAYNFCLEATIFFEQKVGYLGAYDVDGLYAGIFVQITKELRTAMPLIVGGIRLDKFWSYKYIGHSHNSKGTNELKKQRGTSKHTDKASVNMNLWITPDKANLDPTTGGMSIWDYKVDTQEAFARFQRQSHGEDGEAVLASMIEAAKSQSTNIPHRQNRMVIFDSSLVHQTSPMNFRTSHQHRRINLTWLWGDPVWSKIG
jgi:hypothetical protein